MDRWDDYNAELDDDDDVMMTTPTLRNLKLGAQFFV